MNQMVKLFSILVVLIVLTIINTIPVHAAIGQWGGEEQGQVRILTSGGLQEKNEYYLLGIEMALEPGWKTYWRHPGEAGIPTEIDFSASSNLSNSEVLYPIPTTYFDGFSNSIVYIDHVIFPIKVKPKNPNLPIILQANLTYGLCEKVCIPGNAILNTILSPDETVDQISLDAINIALAQVPQSQQLNDKISITKIEKISNGHENPALQITAKIIENANEPNLFVVGPPDIYIDLPQLTSYSKNESQWYLPLSNLEKTGFDLQFILIQESEAIEKKWHLN